MNFGKVSSDDLCLFLSLASKLFLEAGECEKILVEKQEKLFANDCVKPCWHHFYELPMLQHVSQGIELFFEPGELETLVQSPNQIQEMQRSLATYSADMDAWNPDATESEELRKCMAAIYGFSFSLVCSFRSLMVFGAYLNELVARVRAGGRDADAALLAAVKIDPTVLGCQTVMVRLSKATLLKEDGFLRKIRNAIGAPLTKREQSNYQNMRLVLQVLHEMNATKLDAADLYQLFVEELKLIRGESESDEGNVENNLRQFAYQFMKQKAVS